MLIGLSIKDIVLIEALTLEVGPGLTALTGETGAGKSIVLDALGLALGQRADAGLVAARRGASGGDGQLRTAARTSGLRLPRGRAACRAILARIWCCAGSYRPTAARAPSSTMRRPASARSATSA